MNLSARHLDILRRKIPLFDGLQAEQVKQVLEVGEIAEYPKGHILCRDGDDSDHLFILLVGSLKVRAGEVTLSAIEAVDIVGEMGMITGMPRSATVQAVDGVRLIIISKAAFDRLLAVNDNLAARLYRNMFNLLSQRLRENNVNLVKMQLIAGMDVTPNWV